MPQPPLDGLSRRDALKRAGVVAGAAGVAWAAPSITTLGGAAFAAGSPTPGPGGTLATFVLSGFYDGTNNAAGPFSFTAPSGQINIQRNLFGDARLPTLEGQADTNTDASFPFLTKNISTSDVTQRGILFPAGEVVVHPGQPGNPLTITFRAPVTGTYVVSGTLTDADSGGGDGITYALSGGTFSAGGSIANGAGTPLVSGPIVLQADQTIDLVLAAGQNYNNDSTIVRLTVTQTA